MKDVLTVLATLVAMWFAAVVYTISVLVCPWVPLAAVRHDRELREKLLAAAQKAVEQHKAEGGQDV